MTEAEWLACEDSAALLAFVWSRTSERKLRLLAVSCYRRAWDFPPDAPASRAVRIAELFADGLAPTTTLSAAELSVRVDEENDEWAVGFKLAARILAEQPLNLLRLEHSMTRVMIGCDSQLCPAATAELLREVVGNPFRPVPFSPDWRTDTVIALAHQMYEAREFGAMPILADALQDAGCDSADILDHCRGPGPHVRGCWVVDLVLGKE
jgi:hypothetical protein